MAMVDADWSIDRTTGNIRYVGGDHDGILVPGGVGSNRAPTYATVIEFHRWLQDKADNASSSGDDELDITDENPSNRSTDNIITLLGSYNINDIASEHLYDGTVKQGTGGTLVNYDGIVNFGNPEVELGVYQNGAVLTDDFWNLGGHHGTATGGSTSTLVETGAGWTTDEWVGYVVRNTTDGSQGLITANTTDTLTIADLMYGGTNNTNANLEVFYIAKGLNSDATNGISHRFMVKTVTGGANVDNRKIVGFARTFQRTYSEFSINATADGNNVLAVTDSSDLNNNTAPNSVYDSTTTTYAAPFSTMSNITEGYNALDVNNDGSDEFFYSEWNRGTGTINQLYEFTKYQSRYKSELTTPLYGLAGDLFRGITHEIDVSGGAATQNWVQNESVSWTGGTGILFAADNLADASTTKIWIQLLTGTAPSSGTISGALATNTVTGNTARALNYPFVGQSTGSALIGAYGVGVETADLTNSDLLTGLDNVTYQPPNNVSFTVSGLISGEDRVLVGPWDGVSTDSEGNPAIDTDQLDIAVANDLTTDNVTSVVVTATIPSDTPSAGVIRVQDDSGFYRRIKYSSYTGSTFTVDTTYHGSADGDNPGNTTAEDFATTNATAGNNVWIAYIDELAGATSESFTSVYNANRDLVVRVRDGGGSPIKEFITSGELTNAGGSSTAIRTSDT